MAVLILGEGKDFWLRARVPLGGCMYQYIAGWHKKYMPQHETDVSPCNLARPA